MSLAGLEKMRPGYGGPPSRSPPFWLVMAGILSLSLAGAVSLVYFSLALHQRFFAP